jgi:hypothetical protein
MLLVWLVVGSDRWMLSVSKTSDVDVILLSYFSVILVPHSNPKLYIHPLRQIPRDVSIVNNPSIKYILTVHVSLAVILYRLNTTTYAPCSNCFSVAASDSW